ncbi:MAG: alpha/beta fold hydrolase [Rhodobacter sp.]|nr:alpha/beta fold hydrolase [Rhodobacter sp.]
MDWTHDLPTWSLPRLSRRVSVSPHRWHVQESGEGPLILLLPGSGSSVHTWRAMIPALSERHRVVALDLPGQGFTRSPLGTRSGLEEMAADIAKLLRDQGWRPEAILSHSAGTAIALRLSKLMGTATVIGINPALDKFQGVAGWLFPLIARALAISPLTAMIFTASATPERSRRLIEGTGSKLDDEGFDYYARLMRDRAHVNGTLNMMARWSLETLLSELPTLEARTLYLTGARDLAVPPDVATRASERMQLAETRRLEGVGHLAHEEDPERILLEIRDYLPSVG